ncbi:DUF3037 domain-containing protein [Silvibacterium dinghuense]|uniref:DUF3037 domain-containing protein n=1 Tax=Silvibacterium dinghuense TaxID=1560006 RepID=A0A4Q1SJX5_9BACT|nr:DUF3037 domain-containing protein [Silvibacterium dinghuense]RXS97747.1 DUF3037 domain-containing protein [Silvibacterium dinghuense]GGH01686.1 hypothetical protein GCM10011586_16700 [Silvibacterium dinghuense]
MNARIPCEFFLVRYVPDPIRGEFVNIGVLLREAGRPESATVRFTRDWSRVRCIDPEADTEMLEALEGELRQRLTEEGQPVMKTMAESFSQMVQVTTAKPSLAESMVAEMELLLRLHVENRKRESAARKSGRMMIHGRMRSEFERAGVWELMRKRIPVSSYTRAGDPLKIDCGYRPNGVIKVFHAVAPDTDTELAKVLAFSMEGLTKGFAEKEGAALDFAAIVQPLTALAGDPDREEQYRFSLETMESKGIRVLTTERLPLIAETARRELRV